MRTSIIIGVGLAITATVVVATALIADHFKNDTSEEPETTQPKVSEKVFHDGWEEISEEEFIRHEEDNEFEACYASVYSNGYLALDYPDRNEGSCTIIVEPHKLTSQKYIPYDFIKMGGYFINYKTKEVWSVVHLSFAFGMGWGSSSEVDD